MGAFIDAVQVFWAHLSAVRWTPLGLALAFQLAKLVVRGLAWRNILQASYPEERVRRVPVIGAYLAGVGVNAIAPARAGDVVKLYLVKRRIPGSSYATLTPTLVVETLFDFFAAGAVFVWALTAGIVPTATVIKSMPSVDWSWPLQHPNVVIVIVTVIVCVLLFLAMRYGRRVEEFRAKVGRGFAVLHPFSRYLRVVVSWQALSWLFRLAAIYEFLRAFRLTPSLYNTMAVQTVDSLSTLLPFTPGGAGTKQGLTVYALHERSNTAEVSFSVGMNIALVACNVAVGFVALFLLARTLRWRKLADAQKAESEEQGTAPA